MADDLVWQMHMAEARAEVERMHAFRRLLPWYLLGLVLGSWLRRIGVRFDGDHD
jgi:hypothetical protein